MLNLYKNKSRILLLFLMILIVTACNSIGEQETKGGASEGTNSVGDISDIEGNKGGTDVAGNGIDAEKQDDRGERNDTTNYTNGRFGYCIDYPQYWGEAMESENGDGAVLFADDIIDVRVYGSYSLDALGLDFYSYLNEYYDGWEQNEAVVSGADKAVKLIYYGEESYQTALVAEKNGVIYTFTISIWEHLSPEQMDEQSKIIYSEAEAAGETFKVL